MSRFNLDLPIEPAGEVKIGEGTKYEVAFVVPAPVGDKWDKLLPELMKKTKEFYSLRTIGEDTEDEMDAVVGLTESMNDAMDEHFYKLLEVILGIEGEKDAIPYLHKYFPKMRIMELFSSAVALITERSFGGEEVAEAMGKSNGDEEAAIQ